jgi:hypothetical protein
MLKSTQTRRKEHLKVFRWEHERNYGSSIFGRKVVCSFAFHIEVDLPKHSTSSRTFGRPPMITGIPS